MATLAQSSRGLAVWWLLPGVLAAGIATTELRAAEFMLSSTALVFGLYVFVVHGGQRITAAGTVSLGLALFIGAAGLHFAVRAPLHVTPTLVAVTAVAYLSHVVMYLVFWRAGGRMGARTPVGAAVVVVPRRAIAISAAMLGSAYTLRTLRVDVGPVASGAAYCGALLGSIAFAARTSERRTFAGAIGAVIFFVLYVELFFTGGGRLIVGGLAVALIMAFSRLWSRRITKVALIIGAIPALLYFGTIRNPGNAYSGLNSVFSPLRDLGHLVYVDRTEGLERAAGRTFLTAALAQIPSSVWPDKPPGFGGELLNVLYPELGGQRGESIAALLYGEMYFNFGLLGFFGFVPALGLFVRWLDHGLDVMTLRGLNSVANTLRFAMLITASAGLLDAYWGSTFTYSARVGTRVMIFAGLYVIFSRRRWPSAAGLPGAAARQPQAGIVT